MSFGRTNYRIGGTRGGADRTCAISACNLARLSDYVALEFKWDDVKSDKYRENYLGHSVCAPVGRWQRGL